MNEESDYGEGCWSLEGKVSRLHYLLFVTLMKHGVINAKEMQSADGDAEWRANGIVTDIST